MFSLRSEGSCGVGDFGDLKRFITWAIETGQRAVQILPINDTTMTGTWMDSYPYNSISIYAFHPMYIDLRQLPALNDEEAMKAFERRRITLNGLSQVDYEKVNCLKREYLHTLFHQEQEQFLEMPEFKAFVQKNEEWLQPYAAFSVLRDRNGTADFRRWGVDSVYQADRVQQMCIPGSTYYEDICFYYFCNTTCTYNCLMPAPTDAARESS